MKEDKMYSSYEDLLVKNGFEIIESEVFGGYEGDEVYIIKKDGEFGYVVIGYGSCSGCDALEACSSNDDYQWLANSIMEDVVYGSPDELLEKINEGKKSGNYWYSFDSQIFNWLQANINVLKTGEVE